MRKLILTTVMLAVTGISPGFARGGHGHGRSYGHNHAMGALSAPANPAVPPSLTSDARLTGSAPLPSRRQPGKADISSPLKLDPEDAKLNNTIKNICRGC
jgi:hypothetical protein